MQLFLFSVRLKEQILLIIEESVATMKFSVRWIFDHLMGDWRSIDVNLVVDAFNRVTAEIERVVRIEHQLDILSVAQVVSMTGASCTLSSPEWGVTVTVPTKEGVTIGQWYLLKKGATGINWANLPDLASDKEGVLGPVQVKEHEQNGAWKQSVPAKDYILEVDNKSITHRPDLWGHRGMAREIGAYFNIPLKPLSEFLHTMPLKRSAQEASTALGADKLTLKMTGNAPCTSIAATRCAGVSINPSHISMIFMLASVDVKPINSPVDITNFVMFDLGAPMHAFDADALSENVLEVRKAKNGERLVLLDGQDIELGGNDLVITDGLKPISLAGVMGGKSSGISCATTSIILEAGCFDPATIRQTAALHKKRTDASVRFEKNLDANMPVLAIQRFIAVAQQQGLFMRVAQDILVLGAQAHSGLIKLDHEALEAKLGISIAQEKVVEILKKLEFGVDAICHNGVWQYSIIVPPFRATKDIIIKEDIIEEVARFYGYSNLPHCLMIRQQKPWDMAPLLCLRAIKNVLAYGLSMQEVYNYALYDEQFLQRLEFNPDDAAQVQSPVSEHWRRPVTSLIPHLIKTAEINSSYGDKLRFFEYGRTWIVQGQAISEKRVLAGIVVDQKSDVNFYTIKQEIERLFQLLGISGVTWEHIKAVQDPWFALYESAHIMVQGSSFGRAGKINKPVFNRVMHADAFIFELDVEALLRFSGAVRTYKQPSKYPESVRDVSMFIAESLTAQEVLDVVRIIDSRMIEVRLVDFFVDSEAENRKALTVRFTLQDSSKTLTKDEVDTVTLRVTDALQNLGAVIR